MDFLYKYVSSQRVLTCLSREEMDALRGRAWRDAHAEWQNRGLGGFRAWCREDARHGADRLAAETP